MTWWLSSSEIDTLTSEVVEVQVSMIRAGEDRKKENKDFQQTVTDKWFFTKSDLLSEIFC